jgi:hypothetical protein
LFRVVDQTIALQKQDKMAQEMVSVRDTLHLDFALVDEGLIPRG